jgi:integrase/recombinase XerD
VKYPHVLCNSSKPRLRRAFRLAGSASWKGYWGPSSAATEEYKDEFAGRGAENARRMRALVLLLRYRGMRIGDAVSVTSERIENNRLFLYTQKTGVAVNTILPDFVLKALDATPKTADNYFFWDGTSKLETIVGSWRKRLVRLFELAAIQDGHPHRFRNTFAVELLLAGMPIDRVSILLGHSSVRITEKHYSPWVRSRQEQFRGRLDVCLEPRSGHSV